MKRFAFAAAVATTTLGGAVQPAAAEGPITSLEECYNAVITWCNENFPEHDCSNASGLSECDEVFATYSDPSLNLQTRPNDPVARLQILRTSFERPERDEGGSRPDRQEDDRPDRQEESRPDRQDTRPDRQDTRPERQETRPERQQD